MNDPAELQRKLADATDRLLATAEGLTGGQAREPSPLPGWSRGHVRTHIARNADGLRNLLIWARTGAATAGAWPRTRLGRCPRCPHGSNSAGPAARRDRGRTAREMPNRTEMRSA